MTAPRRPIRDLPDDLGKAFRATLEELGDADLLLHLLDASNPAFEEQMESVDRILGDLAYDNIPTLCVFNKVDLLSEEQRAELAQRYDFPQMSAANLESLQPLLARLEELQEAVLGDDAVGAEAVCSFAVEVDAGAGGLEAGHALGEEAAGDAGEDIARAGGAEAGRGVGVDGGAAIGRGDDGVAAFEDDDCAGACGSGAGAVEL